MVDSYSNNKWLVRKCGWPEQYAYEGITFTGQI